jgi:hypothetical protein
MAHPHNIVRREIMAPKYIPSLIIGKYSQFDVALIHTDSSLIRETLAACLNERSQIE